MSFLSCVCLSAYLSVCLAVFVSVLSLPLCLSCVVVISLSFLSCQCTSIYSCRLFLSVSLSLSGFVSFFSALFRCIDLSVCLFFCHLTFSSLSCLPVCPSACLSVCLSAYLSVRLSSVVFVCLSASPSLSLSLPLSIFCLCRHQR